MTIMMMDFRIKQQLAWLNYNMAPVLNQERGVYRVQTLFPTLWSPEVRKDTDGAENGNLWSE